jgi:four helix bundle protein
MTVPFDAFTITLQRIRTLVPVVTVLARHDPDLARQLRRAATSIALNIQEGRGRRGADRIQHWRVALGSAQEVDACLCVAEAFGHVVAPTTAEGRALCSRVQAMLWRLTH